MATADSVKMKIQGLISSANTAAGEDCTDLTSAVEKLIAGYGSSGGATLHTGTYSTDVRHGDDITFSTPGGAAYFVMFMIDAPTTGTGIAFLTSISACKETGRVVASSSNSTGSMATAANVFPTGEPSIGNYPSVSFGTDSVTVISYKPLSNTVRVPQVGKTYVWMAW